MGISLWQIVLVVLLIVLLFGRGKISDLMGDVAKGITSFKKGMQDGAEEPAGDEPKVVEPKVIEQSDETPLSQDVSEKEKAD